MHSVIKNLYNLLNNPIRKKIQNLSKRYMYQNDSIIKYELYYTDCPSHNNVNKFITSCIAPNYKNELHNNELYEASLIKVR